jgi:hypothetical protein
VDKSTLTVSLLALAAAGALAVFAIPGGNVPISGNTGKKLSFVDLLALAQQAGFTGAASVIAAGVALAESGGDPMAFGDRDLAPDNGPSLGLWQINVGTRAHPEYANVNLYDVNVNAQAAFDIYSRKTSFSAWTTFGNKKYLGFVPAKYMV